MPECCEPLLSATLDRLSMKQAGFRIVEQSVKFVRQQAMGERVTMGIFGRDREFLPVSNFVETCRKVERWEMRFPWQIPSTAPSFARPTANRLPRAYRRRTL